MCTGEEESLLQCSRVPQLNIGESDCTHFEDAGVRCEGRKIIYFISEVQSIIMKILKPPQFFLGVQNFLYRLYLFCMCLHRIPQFLLLQHHV